MKQVLKAMALLILLAGTGNILAVEMVRVEGGTFMMGSEYGEDNESPVHEVTLSPYMIGKYEVTVGEFRSFVEDTGYKTIAETDWGSDFSWKDPGFSQTDKHPVTLITWYDAVLYCNWLSTREGFTPAYTINRSKEDPNNKDEYDDNKWSVTCNWTANGYRLPTEAEWDFAARGGNKSKGYRYSGSDDIDGVAWHRDNAGGTTHAVGTKSPNELGICDMSGNVLEWCWDWYGAYPESRSPDPKGAGAGSDRVLRGGSCYNYDYCRIDFRYCIGDAPVTLYDCFRGLRLVRVIK